MLSQEVYSQGYDIARSAAIICKHVAREGRPILLATRDEPVEEADSGWQFTCGVVDHVAANAKIWAVEEVVKLDPSVLPLLDNPARSSFVRSDRHSQWQTRSYVG